MPVPSSSVEGMMQRLLDTQAMLGGESIFTVVQNLIHTNTALGRLEGHEEEEEETEGDAEEEEEYGCALAYFTICSSPSQLPSSLR
jgi:hypothetical protein